MAKDADYVTLATRIPKWLHRLLRIYSVETGVSQMELVCAALEEKLRAGGVRMPREARRRGSGGRRRG